MTSTRLHLCQREWLPVRLIPIIILVAACCAPGVASAAESGRSSMTQVAQAAVGKVSRDQATQAALQALPGKVTDVTIEKKHGKTVYVIEIVADEDGAETDVLVDMDSGKVLGMDR